jgi:hypothetical protein
MIWKCKNRKRKGKSEIAQVSEVVDPQNFLARRARENPAFRSVELGFNQVIAAIYFFITIKL